MIKAILAGLMIPLCLSLDVEVVDHNMEKYVKTMELFDTDNLTESDNLRGPSEIQGWEFENFSLSSLDTLLLHSQDLGFLNSTEEMREAKFIEPQFEMKGNVSGRISRQIHAPANSRIELNFYLFVHGDKLTNLSENSFLSTNIEFQLELSDSNSSSVIDLDRLSPKEDEWKNYEVSFRKESTGADPALLEFRLKRSLTEQHIFIRNMSISWFPILEKEITRPESPVTAPSIMETSEGSSSEASSELSSEASSESSSEASSESSSEASTSPANASTESTIEPISTGFVNITTATASPVTGLENSTMEYSTSTSANETSNEASTLAETGSIGYSGEVFLIILVVILGICFAVLSTKYYFLHKNIGAYRVSSANSTTSSQYSNPSFQENYRDY